MSARFTAYSRGLSAPRSSLDTLRLTHTTPWTPVTGSDLRFFRLCAILEDSKQNSTLVQPAVPDAPDGRA